MPDMIRIKTGVEVTGRLDGDDTVEIPRAESLENAVNAYAYVDET